MLEQNTRSLPHSRRNSAHSAESSFWSLDGLSLCDDTTTSSNNSAYSTIKTPETPKSNNTSSKSTVFAATSSATTPPSSSSLVCPQFSDRFMLQDDSASSSDVPFLLGKLGSLDLASPYLPQTSPSRLQRTHSQSSSSSIKPTTTATRLPLQQQQFYHQFITTNRNNGAINNKPNQQTKQNHHHNYSHHQHSKSLTSSTSLPSISFGGNVLAATTTTTATPAVTSSTSAGHENNNGTPNNSNHSNTTNAVASNMLPSSSAFSPNICRYYLQGYCSRGELCTFAHISRPYLSSVHHPTLGYPNLRQNHSIPNPLAYFSDSSGGKQVSLSGSYGNSFVKGHNNPINSAVDNNVTLPPPPPPPKNTLFSSPGLSSFSPYGYHQKPPLLYQQQQQQQQQQHNHQIYGQNPLLRAITTNNTIASNGVGSQTYGLHIPASQMGKQAVTEKDHSSRYASIPFNELITDIYNVCKDQHGCRYLQKFLEVNHKQRQLGLSSSSSSSSPLTSPASGSPPGPTAALSSSSSHNTSINDNPLHIDAVDHISIIFEKVLPVFADLMVDPFANYFCQRLLEYCNDAQKTLIIRQTSCQLVAISLNTHGTRAVQKLVDKLSNQSQISLFTSSFSQASVKRLIKDLNGNHVIHKCLHCFSCSNSQFIYDTVSRYIVDVATHRHGCCVLQRCIDHASHPQLCDLVKEITSKALVLVQDPYGNYVVQYVLDFADGSFVDGIVGQFLRSVHALSLQKYASNVIEKCIRVAKPETRSLIIEEICSKQHILELLTDCYANYVIQTALDYAELPQRAKLVEFISPLLYSLRDTPHGKKISSKICNNGLIGGASSIGVGNGHLSSNNIYAQPPPPPPSHQHHHQQQHVVGGLVGHLHHHNGVNSVKNGNLILTQQYHHPANHQNDHQYQSQRQLHHRHPHVQYHSNSNVYGNRRDEAYILSSNNNKSGSMITSNGPMYNNSNTDHMKLMGDGTVQVVQENNNNNIGRPKQTSV